MSGHHKWKDIRKDRGNELADIRARAERWIEGAKPYSAPPLALDVLALLSRLDTLTEALERIALGIEGRRLSGYRDGEKDMLPTADWQLAREALSRVSRSEPGTSLNDARLEALRLVATVIDGMGDNAPAALVDAHRVLATGETDESRARSEPAPPNDDEWKLTLEPVTGGLHIGPCPNCGYTEHVAAPPVPEEQQ